MEVETTRQQQYHILLMKCGGFLNDDDGEMPDVTLSTFIKSIFGPADVMRKFELHNSNNQWRTAN